MRFRQSVHPEFLLGLKGSLEVRRIHQEVLEAVRFHNGEWQSRNVNRLTRLVKQNNDIMGLASLQLQWKFVHDHGRIYHVANDLGIALSEVRREIPVQVIPDDFIGYISFSSGVLADDTGPVQGAYVYVGHQNMTPAKGAEPSSRSGGRCIWMAYLNNGDVPEAVTVLLADIWPDCRVDEVEAEVKAREDKHYHLGESVTPTEEQQEIRRRTISAILNACCYIFAPNAVLDVVPPAGPSYRPTKWHSHDDKIYNECVLPITFLDWRYKRQMIHKVDGTWVDVYGRWYRCWTEWKDRRWVMVKGHPRRFKNVRGIDILEPSDTKEEEENHGTETHISTSV